MVCISGSNPGGSQPTQWVSCSVFSPSHALSPSLPPLISLLCLSVGIGMPGLNVAGALAGPPNSLSVSGGPAPNMGIMAMMSAMPPPSLNAIQARGLPSAKCQPTRGRDVLEKGGGARMHFSDKFRSDALFLQLFINSGTFL